jgi:hypothetical protein
MRWTSAGDNSLSRSASVRKSDMRLDVRCHRPSFRADFTSSTVKISWNNVGLSVTTAIHLTVEYTVRIGDIYKKIEECVGYAVFLQQTDKKNTVILDPDEIAEDGMNFGYSVQVKRRKPKLESHFAENVAQRSWTRRLYEIPGVLRAAAGPADEAKSANEGKEAQEPDPPPEERGRS